MVQAGSVLAPAPDPGAPTVPEAPPVPRWLTALGRPRVRRLVFGPLIAVLLVVAAVAADAGYEVEGQLLFARPTVVSAFDASGVTAPSPQATTAAVAAQLSGPADDGTELAEVEVVGDDLLTLRATGGTEDQVLAGVTGRLEDVATELDLVRTPSLLVTGRLGGEDDGAADLELLVQVDPRRTPPLVQPNWQGARGTGYYGELLDERVSDAAFVARATGRPEGELLLSQTRWDTAPVLEVLVRAGTADAARDAYRSAVAALRVELDELQANHAVPGRERITLVGMTPVEEPTLDPRGLLDAFFLAVGALLVAGVWAGLATSGALTAPRGRA